MGTGELGWTDKAAETCEKDLYISSNLPDIIYLPGPVLGFCCSHQRPSHQERTHGLPSAGLVSLRCSLSLQPAAICPCRFAAQDLKPSPEGRRPEPGRGLGSTRQGPGCRKIRGVLSYKKQPSDEASCPESSARGERSPPSRLVGL